LLKAITDISLTDAGAFQVDFNTGESFKKTIKWPTSVTVETDGTLTVTYNDSTTKVYKNYVKAITNIQIDTGSTEGEGTQKI
jgi:hypothetical protein